MLPPSSIYLRLFALGALAAPGALTAQPDVAATPPASTAAVSDDGHALSGLTAAQMFEIADQARTAGRVKDAEAIYKALEHDPKVEIRSEARFRLGMMYAAEKRYTDAAVTFRAILDEQPKAARVRLELARVLALMGDEGGARRQLRQAQATGLPPQVALVVNRYAQALRSTKTFGGNFEFSAAPDSNINRATSSKTLDLPVGAVTLSNDAQAQSGIGAHLAGQIYARIRTQSNLTLVPRLSGDGTLYRHSEFNDISGSAALGFEWQTGKDRITPSGGVTWRSYGGHPYARTVVGDIHWVHQIDPRTQMDASGSIGHSTFLRNHLQDGDLFNAGITIEHALSARSGIGVVLSGQRQNAIEPAYATSSGGLTLIGWRDLGKVTLFANATGRRLESDGPMYFGPLGAKPRRREWYVRAQIGATFRQIEVAGFSPVLRIGYERNFSTNELYDYKRFNVDFGITRAF